MADLSIPEELRAAVVKLRCEHAFPCNPPGGTLVAPGACTHCGMPWADRLPVADLPEALRAPLAALLDRAAAHLGEARPAYHPVLVDQLMLDVARALNAAPAPAETGGAS